MNYCTVILPLITHFKSLSLSLILIRSLYYLSCKGLKKERCGQKHTLTSIKKNCSSNNDHEAVGGVCRPRARSISSSISLLTLSLSSRLLFCSSLVAGGS